MGPAPCECVASEGDPADGPGLRFVPDGLCHCLPGARATAGEPIGAAVYFVHPDGDRDATGTESDPWDRPRWDLIDDTPSATLRVAATDDAGDPATYSGRWATDMPLVLVIDGGWTRDGGAWVPAPPDAYPAIDGLRIGGTAVLEMRHVRLGGGGGRALELHRPGTVILDDIRVDASGQPWGAVLGREGARASSTVTAPSITIRSSTFVGGTGPALSVHGSDSGSPPLTIQDSVFIGGRGRGTARADGLDLRRMVDGTRLERVVIAGAARGLHLRNAPLEARDLIVASSTEDAIRVRSPRVPAGDNPLDLRGVTIHGSRGDGLSLDGSGGRTPLTVNGLEIFDVDGTAYDAATGSTNLVDNLVMVDVETFFGGGTPAPDSCAIDSGVGFAAQQCIQGARRPTREALSGPDRVLFTQDDVRANAPDGPVDDVWADLRLQLLLDGDLVDAISGDAALAPEDPPAFTTDRAGRPDRALDSSQCVEVPAEFFLAETSVTLATWMRSDRDHSPFAWSPGARWGSMEVGASYGEWSFYDANTLSTRATGVPVEDGVWTHVAMVIDREADQNRMYVDGERVTTGTRAEPAFSYVWVLGCQPQGWFAIDDYRLYTRALTDEEVARVAAQ